jgi:branched-chain amino acid aminotransferase
MNVFFIIDNTAYTPDLSQGTILDGITRQSSITILRDMGMEVVEKMISIDEIIEAHKKGTLQEVFGTGTAATISQIQELRYKDYVMNFVPEKCTVAIDLKKRLNDIRYGKTEDIHGWLYKI